MALDAAFVDKMRAELSAERDGLKRQLDRIAGKDPKTPGDYDTRWPNYNNDEREPEEGGVDALETQDYANTIGVENILELRLLAVERALRRIAKGTYGRCSNCQADQPQARLAADPAAERCLSCKEPV